MPRKPWPTTENTTCAAAAEQVGSILEQGRRHAEEISRDLLDKAKHDAEAKDISGGCQYPDLAARDHAGRRDSRFRPRRRASAAQSDGRRQHGRQRGPQRVGRVEPPIQFCSSLPATSTSARTSQFNTSFSGAPAQTSPGYFVARGPYGVTLPGAPPRPHVTPI